MARTQFIEHQGRQIVFIDLSGIDDPAEGLAAIEEARAFIAALPREGNLLTLTYVRDSHFDTTVVAAARKLVEHNRPWVRAGAVVGLSGLMRVVYSTLVHLTGRNLKAFDSLDEAKAYLATQ